MKATHNDIESAFFEFSKMKTLLTTTNISLRIAKVPLAPLPDAQQYIYSMLLIDLISVVDKAIHYLFTLHKMKPQKGKSKLVILEENGHVHNPRYLEWYREWRHESAHNWIKHESFKLDQAVRDVADQFKRWGFASATLKFQGYVQELESAVKIGVTASGCSILEYEAWSDRPLSGSSRKTIDMSWSEFKAKIPNQINT